MFKNNKLRLLMTLVGFERLDEDVPAATWIVPSSLSASDLEPKLHQVQRAEMGEDPIEYDDTHPGPADCVRRKNTRKAQSPRRTTALQSDSEGNESIDDDLLFPDNLPDSQRSKPRKDPSKKRRKRLRNASELGDEEKAKRLKARKDADLQKRSKIKSALYVHDSDDATDEERDSLFFAKEEQLRKAAGNATSKTIGGTKPVSKKRKKSVGDDTNKPTNKRRKSVESEAPSDMEGLDQDIVEISSDASSESDDEPHLNTDGDSEKADEGTDTPVSSQLQATSPKILDTSFDKASQTAEDVSMTDAGDDKDQPVQKEALRRNIRAGFIINDSDSE
jgi:replication fork protection complex subunit Tof1/Swi1